MKPVDAAKSLNYAATIAKAARQASVHMELCLAQGLAPPLETLRVLHLLTDALRTLVEAYSFQPDPIPDPDPNEDDPDEDPL